MLNIELYNSELVNPIILLRSSPRLIDGFKEKVSLALVSSKSKVSSAFP